MESAVMVDIIFTIKDELTIFAVHLVLEAFLVVVLSYSLPVGQALGTVLAVMVTDLVVSICSVGYRFRSFLAVATVDHELL